MDAEKLRRAREALLVHHDQLLKLFGPDYELGPRFTEAVEAVARGRMPRYVLDDYVEVAPATRTPVDRTGWTW